MATLNTVVPALPVLLGLTGVGVGIYSFVSPLDAIRMFGLRAPSPSDKNLPSAHAEAFQKSAIYIYGIRNIGVGLANLGIFVFWKLSPVCQTNPAASDAVRLCLGICLILGTTVGLGDAWIIRKFAKDEGVQGEAKTEATKASVNHAITAAVILATGVFLAL
ncbi:uncharacterized protein NECHADRAFT_51923 [Fusarium vanettenii 77-13-4]|uniref:Uncharacterized protein n=1 Tax=Fusarium vanettenii (strain ATCC MYA-4622 / CBS 123669 / FGSC 9596 / NRRL 45880 / 77-13-4) TaxID=660122 RepID=C7ZHB7_FUSV7|nr:uncharacterized protein NECHADRAFT_51923 [Fusarium vanettenii 77-13-4]EEU36636.1 hypothetical protein NECHADRAFT_51923 [Fusarium vanettenii 77-13-4]